MTTELAGVAEDFDIDYDDEELSSDGSEYFDDDDDDDDDDDGFDEAEFLPRFLDPLGISKGISNLIRPKPRRKIRHRRVPGRGVGGATIMTPRGQARLRLPSRVPTLSQFRKLESSVRKNAGGVNRLGKDLVRTQVQAKVALGKVSRAIKDLKKGDGSSGLMNMMLSMMQNQALRGDINSHHHGDDTVPEGGTPPASAIKGKDNSMMMLLPMMMGQGSDGKDDNSMMMLMMMMAMQQGKN